MTAIPPAPPSTAHRRARGRRAPAGLVVVVSVLVLGCLIPVWYVAQSAIALGPEQLRAILMRPYIGRLLVDTVLLVVFTLPSTIVIAVAGAWLVERTTLPARRVLAVALAAPLAIPAFVASYGWASAIPAISGLGGGVLVATLAYYPLVYLPVLAALRGLDPALEESARSLGMGSWAVFFRVVVPQLRLALLGGALVVGLHLLAEYGAFAFLRFDTFTTAIVVAYQSTFAGPNAAGLGIVLTVLTVVLLAIEAAARGRLPYARVGGGSVHPAVRLRLGRWAPAALAALLAVVGAGVVVPLATVVRWLAVADAADYASLGPAAAQTIALAVAGASCAIVVAVPIAWLSVRYPGRWARVLEGAAYLAGSLPAIIVALALVVVSLRLVPAIYQTVVTVTAAYVILFLPRALVTIRAGLAQVPESLEEAARSLGRSPVVARLLVTMPLLLPSLAAAAALVGLGAANELTATLLLAPTGTRTIATEFWSAASAVDYPAAAPSAVALVLLSAPAVALMFIHATRRSTR